jgi:predicted AAA+ superfamily ATPase
VKENISVKRSLQGLSRDVNNKLESHANATKTVSSNVETKIELHEGSVDKGVGELQGG